MDSDHVGETTSMWANRFVGETADNPCRSVITRLAFPLTVTSAVEPDKLSGVPTFKNNMNSKTAHNSWKR